MNRSKAARCAWRLPGVLLVFSLVGCASTAPSEVSFRAEDCQVEEVGGGAHRKSAVVTDFAVKRGAAGGDLQGIGEVLGTRLADYLQTSGRLRVRASGREPTAAPSSVTALPVRDLGEQYAAQFVVTGRVLDMSLAEPLISMPWLDGQRIVAGQRRHLHLQIEVYDGWSGALLMQQSMDRSVRHVPMESGQRLGPGFWRSRYGDAAADALDALAEAALDWMACTPLSVPVLRVDGGEIMIRAGGHDGVRAGDAVELYAVQAYRPAGTAALPRDIRLLGEARVERVSDDHAVLAVDDAAHGVVRVGDLVRARQ